MLNYINMKCCKDCLVNKTLDSFYVCGKYYLSYCKKCHIKRNIGKQRSTRKKVLTPKSALITRARGIKNRCGRSKHYIEVKCKFSCKEFVERYENDSTFLSLFSQWIDSGRCNKLRPSVDRINSKGDYEFTNIQWITLAENTQKAMYEFHKKGGAYKKRPVYAYGLDGVWVGSFKSLKEASKFVNKTQGGSNILLSCKNSNRTAYGYKWKFVDK